MADPIKLGGTPGDAPAGGSTPKIDLGAPSLNIGAPGQGTAGSVPSTAPKPASSGESMGNIFTQSQAKKEESKMISSIISKKDVAQKSKSILGPAPTLEKSIEQEKEAAQKRKLRLYQFIFLAVFLAGAAAAFYFYAELSPDFSLFGVNTTQRLTDTNASLRQVQTLVNRDRYLAAQLKLNEFSYQADRFMSSVPKVNDPAINEFDKRAIVTDMEESKNALPVLLGDIRGLLTQNIVAETYRSEKEPEQTPDQILATAQEDLRSALRETKKQYNQDTPDPQEILDIKLVDNAIKLVGNRTLLNALQGTSVDTFKQQLDDYALAPDPQKLKSVQDVISKVLSSTQSDLATIADVKTNRVMWSDIIGQIKEETLNVDPNFDQPLLYGTLGGVVYNGYEFDSNSNKIVLSGTTKKLDGSNFTLLSNLIDQLENSRYFKDVDMRSFTKGRSGTGANEGFTANFKIDLSLETEGFADNNAPLSLQSDSLRGAATGTSRTGPATGTTQESVSTATTPTETSSASAPAPTPAVDAPEEATESAVPATEVSTPVSSESTSAEAPAAAGQDSQLPVPAPVDTAPTVALPTSASETTDTASAPVPSVPGTEGPSTEAP